MGRNDDCQLRAANPYVSHRHCELRTEGDKIIIHDCHSTNGTFINTEKIEEDVELHEGDRIKIGSLSFLVCQEDQNGAVVSLDSSQPEEEPTAPAPQRKVDEEAIGDMLLDLDEEDSGPPAGAWRNANSPDAGSERSPAHGSESSAAKASRRKDSSAPDVASKMLQGKDTSWLKPK
jgi:pSer/pThr/pTyr-binding forkhead associated (FHA) protein